MNRAANTAHHVYNAHCLKDHWLRNGEQIFPLLEEAAAHARAETLRDIAELAAGGKTRDESLLMVEEYLQAAGVFPQTPQT